MILAIAQINWAWVVALVLATWYGLGLCAGVAFIWVSVRDRRWRRRVV